jgi:hypothetical protein
MAGTFRPAADAKRKRKNMKKVTAEALESSFRFPRGTEIGRIERFQSVLKINVTEEAENLGAQ